MKKVWLLALPLIIAGCGEDSARIETVKNSFMDDERTIQVGKILDNRKICKKTDWSSATDNLGRDLVVYECQFVDSSKEFKARRDALLSSLKRTLQGELTAAETTANNLQSSAEQRFDNKIEQIDNIIATAEEQLKVLNENPLVSPTDLGFNSYAIDGLSGIEYHISMLESLIEKFQQFRDDTPPPNPNDFQYPLDYQNNLSMWKSIRSSRVENFRHNLIRSDLPPSLLNNLILPLYLTNDTRFHGAPLSDIYLQEADFDTIKANLPKIEAELQSQIKDLLVARYELVSNLLTEGIAQLKQERKNLLADRPDLSDILPRNEYQRYEVARNEEARLRAILDNFDNYTADYYKDFQYQNIKETLVWVVNDRKEVFFLEGVVEGDRNRSNDTLFEYQNYFYILNNYENNNVIDYLQLSNEP